MVIADTHIMRWMGLRKSVSLEHPALPHILLAPLSLWGTLAFPVPPTSAFLFLSMNRVSPHDSHDPALF